MGSLFGSSPSVIKTGDIADKSFDSTVNQIGPGFSTSHGFDARGNRVQRFNLSDNQKRLQARREKIALALDPVGKDLTGGIRGSLRTAGTTGDAAEKATFDRALALLEPQMERRERSVRNSLVNSGNPIGSERAGYELDQLNRDRTSTLNDLALGSVLAGQQARSREISNAGQQVSQLGNLLSIMGTDRPQYFQAGQLLSPETVLNRSLSKAQLKSQRNAGLDSLAGGLLSGGARIASAGLAAPPVPAGPTG